MSLFSTNNDEPHNLPLTDIVGADDRIDNALAIYDLASAFRFLLESFHFELRQQRWVKRSIPFSLEVLREECEGLHLVTKKLELFWNDPMIQENYERKKEKFKKIAISFSSKKLADIRASPQQALAYYQLWKIFKNAKYFNRTLTSLSSQLQSIMATFRSQQSLKNLVGIDESSQFIIFSHDVDNLLAILLDGVGGLPENIQKEPIEMPAFPEPEPIIDDDDSNSIQNKKTLLKSKILSHKFFFIGFIITLLFGFIILWSSYHTSSYSLIQNQVKEVAFRYRERIKYRLLDNLLHPSYIVNSSKVSFDFNNFQWDDFEYSISMTTYYDNYFIEILDTFDVNAVLIAFPSGLMAGAQQLNGQKYIFFRNNTVCLTWYSLTDTKRSEIYAEDCIFNPLIQPWFDFNENDIWVQNSFYTNMDNAYVTYSVPLHGKVINRRAVFLTQLSYVSLGQQMKSEKFPFQINPSVFVVDLSQDLLLFNSQSSYYTPFSSMQSDVAEKTVYNWYKHQKYSIDSEFVSDLDGNDYIISASSLKTTVGSGNLNWNLIVAFPFSSLESPIRYADIASGILLVIFLGLLGSFTWFIKKNANDELPEELMIENELSPMTSTRFDTMSSGTFIHKETMYDRSTITPNKPIDRVDCIKYNLSQFYYRIIIWIIIIFIIWLCVFISWSFGGQSYVEDTQQTTVLENVKNVYRTTEGIFRDALFVLSVISSKQNDILQNINHENLLRGILGTFRSTSGLYMVDSIYFYRDEDRSFTIVSRLYPDGKEVDKDDSFLVGTMDTTNKYCYTKYLFGYDDFKNYSNILWKNDGCLYEPTKRPWYGVPTTTWSEIYMFESGHLGITLSKPIQCTISSDNCIYIAIDIALTSLNLKIQHNIPPDIETCALNSDGYLFFSSSGVTSYNVQNHTLKTKGIEDPSPALRNSAKYIDKALTENGVYDWSEYRKIFQIHRSIFDPFSFVLWMYPVQKRIIPNFLSIVSLSSEKYQEPVTKLENEALLITSGLFLIALIFLGRGLYSLLYQDQPLPYADDLSAELDEDSLRRKLQRYARLIGPLVRKAYQSSSYRNSSILSLKEEFANAIPAAAYSYIRGMKKKRNMLIACSLTNVSDRFPLFLYKFIHNVKYRTFISLSICIHISLAFIEPPTTVALQTIGIHWGVLFTEGICLFIELFDLVIKLLLFYYFIPNASENLPEQVRRCFRINHSLNSAHCLVWILIFLDWIATQTIERSVEYFFPLRPFLLIITNGQVQTALHVFFVSMAEARYAFLMFFCLLIIISTMGIVVFRGYLTFTRDESSYSDFIRSLTTTFILITTGENYTDLVYPAADSSNPAYVLFFIISILLSMFFVLPMVLALFQFSFKKIRKVANNIQVSQARSALVAAFITLDRDRGGKLDINEFRSFLDFLKRRQTKPKDERRYWQQFIFPSEEKEQKTPIATNIDPGVSIKGFNQSSNSNLLLSRSNLGSRLTTINEEEQHSIRLVTPRFKVPLEIHDFVAAMEEYAILLHFRTKSGKKSWFRSFFKRSSVESYWFRTLQFILVVINIWLISFYGTATNEIIIDALCVVLLIIYLIFLCISLLVYGLDEYWNYKKYTADVKAITQMHRVDLVTIILSIVLYIFFTIISQEFGFTSHPWFRLCFCIPCFRIFFLIAPVRHLVSTLIQILPRFASLIFLMLVLMFMFGLIGVNIFAGKFTNYFFENSEVVYGNFDSLTQAMLTLFQMLVGESWYQIMYAAIKVTSWRVSWYFTIFIMIITLLFTNLFLSIVLDAFQAMMELEVDGEKVQTSDEPGSSDIDQEILKRRRRALGANVFVNF